jgi:hypothetical protein
MGRAAILQFPGYLRKRKLLLGQQIFYTFYLLGNNELLNGHSPYFRKGFGERSIVDAKMFTDIFRIVDSREFEGIMNHVDDEFSDLQCQQMTPI